MGKLSKKKDKKEDDKAQKKITGFFQIPKPFTSIQDSTNTLRAPEDFNPSEGLPTQGSSAGQPAKGLLKNVNIQRVDEQPSCSGYKNAAFSQNNHQNYKNADDDPEVIESTPEVSNKFQTKKAKPAKSCASKRKLSDELLSPKEKKLKMENKENAELDQVVSEFDDIDFDIDDWELEEKSKKSQDRKLQANIFLDKKASNDEQPLASKFNRHKIVEIDDTVANQLILILEDAFDPCVTRKAIIKGTWLQTVLNEGDIVHIEGNFNADTIVITDSEGSLIVNPDHLVSGSAVVSALFCLRKAVLSEIYKGGGGGSKVMLLGTFVHELLQTVLKHKEYSKERITDFMDSLLKTQAIVQEMSYLGLTEEEMRKDIVPFLNHIQYFVKKYIHGENVAAPDPSTPDRPKKGMARPQWRGRIQEIVDIEENFWSPRLGMKGKIDLTVRAEGSRKLIPLELKTGKPSFSSEHSGQVMLYSMMSRDRRADPESGLLLYLRSSNIVEIPCRRNEERGLIQLRNQLVAFLSQTAKYENDQVTDLVLPEPIDFEKACAKCDFLDVCTVYQKTQETVLHPSHPMRKLVPESLTHLQTNHLDWFKHWSDILRLEASETRSSVKHLWCETPTSREKAGSCIQGLMISTVDDCMHTFCRSESDLLPQSFQAGDVVILSSTSEFALSQGPVLQVDSERIVVQLDRDLRSGREWKTKKFILDKHIYQGSMGSNFVAIGKLLSNTPEAKNLRSIIIEKEPVRFLPGLGREVAVTARGIIKTLNKIQQKAIFRCMMTENYCLIRGMPGSGKSTTIVGLIRLLAKLGQSVLLVAYTNSAVDTVLCKLKEFESKFLRLGRRSRVRQELQEFTADFVSKDITCCDDLTKLYNSYNIVATTCLATDHAATANRQFDWCIIDEASQALLPSVIHPILHSKKFVLVGDPAQLPPVVQNVHARKLGLSESLFDRLDRPESTLDLNIQYRMNQTIADLANHLTYKGKLECANETVAKRQLCLDLEKCDPRWLQVSLSSKPELSVVFLDTGTSGEEENVNGGIRNPAEGRILLKLVKQASEKGLKTCEISVIAPYSAQVKYIESLLRQHGLSTVEVGTVDQFQGRDSELVIYSCTRSFVRREGDENTKRGHILNDERRLNVAITRARSKLILVGSLHTLVREYKPFREMRSFLENDRICQLTSEEISNTY